MCDFLNFRTRTAISCLARRFFAPLRSSPTKTSFPYILPPLKYIPAPNFGERTGMTRDRFNDVFRYMVWSRQPSQRPEGMSSETYRWMLIQDFIDNFNDHRSSLFLPGWLICVDESMSRWYGLGGHWINMGLPMYVAIDRKPEDGLEIQNSACSHSGIMYQLKLVKTAESNAA